jgi:putative membrane protein
MIVPLFLVGGWATCITCISKFVKPRSSPLPCLQPNSGRLIISVVVNPVLLTILGFVVGLALSFRSSSAYER